MLAWYSLFGTAEVALGTLACGWVVTVLQHEHGWEVIHAYRLVFATYAAVGVVKFVLCLLLSEACEVESETLKPQTRDDEQRPLLTNERPDAATTSPGWAVKVLIPTISGETKPLLLRLGILFAMDSLASGLSADAWMVYFFASKFGLAEEKLGDIFFVTNIVSCASNLVASSLAQRIGLVETMDFTHAPASIALALVPVPNNIFVAMALLIFRSSTNNMDQAKRQAFLAAAVLPQERTSVMGMVNVVKTLAQSIGPVTTGRLAGSGRFWVALVIAGSLKLLYDVLLLGMFPGYKNVEDKAQETIGQEGQGDQEDDNNARTDRH